MTAPSGIAKQFSGLPLKALIGAPLKAATDANGMMARAQADFLLDTCFEKDESAEGHLKPVMIRFKLERQSINEKGEMLAPLEMDMSLPLMTIIPLNSLAIDNMKISFEMDVKSSTERHYQSHASQSQISQANSSSQQTAPKNGFSVNSHAHQFDTEMHGSLAKSSKGKSSQQSTASAKYEIELQASQLPLPKGVTAIIDAFSKSFSPVTVKS